MKSRNKLNFLPFIMSFSSFKYLFSLCLPFVVSVCFLFVLPSVVFAQSNNEYHDIYIKEPVSGDVCGNSENKDVGNCKLDPNHNRVYVSNDVKRSIFGANGNVCGACVEKGDVNNNSATITSGTIEGDVFGGWTGNGNANSNSVTIAGGTIKGHVAGGWTMNGNVNSNSVTIAGGTINRNVAGGCTGNGNANSNSVTIANGTIEGYVYGGRAINGNANSNSVTISSGGTIEKSVYGGYADDNGIANNNSVTIAGGTIKGHVFGGRAINDNANNNSVTITGGTIKRDVFGGLTEGAGNSSTGNTVKISGNPKFDTNTVIYGGRVSGEGDDAFTNNRLIIDTKILVKKILNFQHYDFYLPKDMGAGDAMITIDNKDVEERALNKDATDKDVTITVSVAPDAEALNVGDRRALIKNRRGFSDTSFNRRIYAEQGFGVIYDFKVVAEGESNVLLVANVVRAVTNPQTKVFSEGRAASIAFIGQGNELIADKGISAAVTSLGSASNASGIAPFIAAVGGKSKYDTGSHADVSGATLAAGLAKEFELKNHKITAGAFIERGEGKYKSLNTIAFGNEKKDVKANGITQYTGAGLLGRIDFSNNFYAQVSGKVASAKSNFHSDDIKFKDEPASYDYNGVCLGAHIGSGYIYEINNKLGLDVSGKYFFTHQGSKDVELPTKEIIKFANTSSRKIRLGAKLTYKATKVFKPYVEGAFEYELAGKVDATIKGFDVDAPTLKGGGAIGEFGVTSNVGKFVIDVGAIGYAGARTGIDGMLKVKYAI
ncbi:MAG: hypothetical protein LE168_04800 [Endomicrobium sp.]|nr:hypothetical protein [Endomicrobium sp.]